MIGPALRERAPARCDMNRSTRNPEVEHSESLPSCSTSTPPRTSAAPLKHPRARGAHVPADHSAEKHRRSVEPAMGIIPVAENVGGSDTTAKPNRHNHLRAWRNRWSIPRNNLIPRANVAKSTHRGGSRANPAVPHEREKQTYGVPVPGHCTPIGFGWSARGRIGGVGGVFFREHVYAGRGQRRGGRGCCGLRARRRRGRCGLRVCGSGVYDAERLRWRAQGQCGVLAVRGGVLQSERQGERHDAGV